MVNDVLQRNHVYTCQCDESGSRRNWSRMQELQQLELPRKTLLEIDLVKEYQGEVSTIAWEILAMMRFGEIVQNIYF